MAKVKITGHASGTGVVTVTAPNTNTDRTITLPDATATIATTTDVAARLPSITDGGNATAITIDSSENVGIGRTSNIDHPIDIQKADNAYARISSATTQENAGILLANQNTTKWTIEKYGSSHNLFIRNTSTDSLELTQDGRGLSQFTAKAWVNFNGTGTVAIRDSHNISSITDLNTGNYRATFTVAMANTNYCYSLSDSYLGQIYKTSAATAHIQLQVVTNSLGGVDDDAVSVLIFGD